jgi:Xaa-Pro aminopeptidase
VHCGENADLANAQVEVLQVKSYDEIQTALGDLLVGRRIGLNDTHQQYLETLVKSALPDAECTKVDSLLNPLRVIKDSDEIRLLREAVALTDEVMQKVAAFIRPEITQLELQSLIAQTGLKLGAEDVSFPPTALFTKSGTEPSDSPFVYPKEQGLVKGSSIAFDFGFVLNGYCSDFGRSFYCGNAPPYISGAYSALQQSQCELLSKMKPYETKLNELFGIIEEALDRRGYGDRLRARLPDGTLGHQIGIDLHEEPWLRNESDIVLEPGMVMAIEPKLWFPGEYYLRVEDIVLITEQGAESLTRFCRDMFELPLR